QQDSSKAAIQACVNHQCGEQINLCAEQMAQALECGFPEHREERSAQDEDGVDYCHCSAPNKTQTSSSAFRFAPSFTRATVERPYSAGCESTILPMGNSLG